MLDSYHSMKNQARTVCYHECIAMSALNSLESQTCSCKMLSLRWESRKNKASHQFLSVSLANASFQTPVMLMEFSIASIQHAVLSSTLRGNMDCQKILSKAGKHCVIKRKFYEFWGKSWKTKIVSLRSLYETERLGSAILRFREYVRKLILNWSKFAIFTGFCIYRGV